MANVKELSFNERAELFKKGIIRLQKKYDLVLVSGYINSYDDDANIIISDEEGKNEVYFDTLSDYL